MYRKGFTLVELLVVVLIIGILSAMAIPQYLKAAERARAAQAISILGSLVKAERIYQSLHSTMTPHVTLLDFTEPVTFKNNSRSVFATKDFLFTARLIKLPNSNGDLTRPHIVVSAQRSDGFTPFKGKDAYMINVVIYNSGKTLRWCLPGSEVPKEHTQVPEKEADIATLSGKADSVKICRAIADGDIQGIIR